MESSPVAPWCTGHQAKLQRVLYPIYLLPTQADKPDAVIDTLRAIVVPNVERHSSLPAVDQKADDGTMS
jgi:hypothetical protein